MEYLVAGGKESLAEKLQVLTDAAKYDVACTSSGVERKGNGKSIGNCVAAGICHSFSGDGRCISLLKILLTNECIFDCKYCRNRRSNDIPRAAFTPEEICTLTMEFYRRNYIEGLFLSSGIIRDPTFTMELLCRTLALLRNKYRFNGYVHVKAIPGADPEVIERTGYLADRMSVNLELPTAEGLRTLAPNKHRRSILTPMRQIQNGIQANRNDLALYRHAPRFVAGGQSTQVIVGATPESDYQIINVAEGLYQKFGLKRVFYSAFVNVTGDKSLPALPGLFCGNTGCTRRTGCCAFTGSGRRSFWMKSIRFLTSCSTPRRTGPCGIWISFLWRSTVRLWRCFCGFRAWG